MIKRQIDCIVKSIRMNTEGLSDYPSNSQYQLEGVAVGQSERYTFDTRLSEGEHIQQPTTWLLILKHFSTLLLAKE